MNASPHQEHPHAAPWPSAARGWTIAVLLALASIVSQADRVVLNLMIEPVKAEFGLDDTGFGMLQGVAFGIFYTICTIPLGRLSDRYPRKLIIGTCVGLWSLFAMASGLARTYAQLFLTRIGVGVGEASLTPAGLSLLSDMFPPSKLGRAVSVFFLSAPIGIGLALIAGGELLNWLVTSGVLVEGPLAGLKAWQAAFLIVGFPGLLLVPALLLMREPTRRGAGSEKMLSVREVGGVVRHRAGALIPMFAGFSMVTLVSYAYNIWTPALFIRVYGWTPTDIGRAFGLIMLVFGTGGVYFAGWLSDRLTQRGDLDAHLKVAAFGFVGCGVLGALAPLMPSAGLALALLGPAIFLSNMPYSCAGTAIQLIIPNRARAQVTAIYIMIITLVGLVVGPLVIGLMTDHLFRDPADIRYSLAIVVGLAAPIMCTLLLIARRPYRMLRAAD
jgi:MFS family permease